ncbi:PD-(D/E)XK motif protein [Arthrobacter rhombi]|uniref:PD-(D/E)XK motif protein n=1 Tax=Arthrobacter rhombi TaxID=71253 RepID=UPI003FD0B4A0
MNDLHSAYTKLSLKDDSAADDETNRISVVSAEVKGYYVSIDSNGSPGFLIENGLIDKLAGLSFRLESIEIDSLIRVEIDEGGCRRDGLFCYLHLRSTAESEVYYFYLICDALMGDLGPTPAKVDVEVAVDAVVQMFNSRRKPASRSLQGLAAELLFIYLSRDPGEALSSWHGNASDRFDFAFEHERVEVKSTSTYLRRHRFSYEQMNYPSGKPVFVCSFFIVQQVNGMSVSTLIESLLKLGDVMNVLGGRSLLDAVSVFAGETLPDFLEFTFDFDLAVESVQIYRMPDVPGIREQLPPEVSALTYDVDLSALAPIAGEERSRILV